MYRLSIFAFLLAALAAPAWAGSVALLLSNGDGLFSGFAETFEETLAGSNWTVTTATVDAAPGGGPPADLIVTVGSEALRSALSRPDHPPILATLLPRLGYERLLTESRRSAKVSAIYLDQPPARQVAFLRQLFPGRKHFSMLVSPEYHPQVAAYRQAFGNSGLSIEIDNCEGDDSMLGELPGLLARSTALLAVPDSRIYRRDNIRAILVSAYRYRRPVIGYSTAFVNAGALAALHTTPRQVARQAAETLLAHGANLPPPSDPKQFAIAINGNVAQALGIRLPDEATIRRALLAEPEAR